MKTREEIKSIVVKAFSEIDGVPIENISEDDKVIEKLKTSCVGRCRLQVQFLKDLETLMPTSLAVKAETVKDVIDFYYENQPKD